MERELARAILWGTYENNQVYYYGSLLKRQGTDVFFENLRFPSGVTIKAWSSRTNYQAERRVPELPLLLPGAPYRLQQELVAEPANTVYFLVQFFNRQNEEIGLTVLKNGKETFTYPKETFTYTIKMVNAGCLRLHFSKLIISGPAPATNLVTTAESAGTGVIPTELDLVKPLFSRDN
ncbi:TPA: accessory Sec system protein Asp3 [Streptococcus suis]